MISLELDHDIDFTGTRTNWLGYSHSQRPVDRQVVLGFHDYRYPNVRMAKYYFLTDFAHNLLHSGYTLKSKGFGKWLLDISDHKQAAAFKLVFL